jgi:hypothetical protein
MITLFVVPARPGYIGGLAESIPWIAGLLKRLQIRSDLLEKYKQGPPVHIQSGWVEVYVAFVSHASSAEREKAEQLGKEGWEKGSPGRGGREAVSWLKGKSLEWRDEDRDEVA